MHASDKTVATGSLPGLGFRCSRHLVLLTALVTLSACSVGPDYVRPSFEAPTAYKEAGPWKTAIPGQIDGNHRWWEAYGDSVLSDLIDQANSANQNIRYAEAQFRQSQATARVAQAGFWPTAGISAGAARGQTNTNGTIRLADTYTTGLNATWEADVWGRVRRSVEAGDAGSQASAATLAAARLSIQATLAQNYLQLRVTDLLSDLYLRTTQAYTRTFELTQRQYAAGIALRSDVAQAETQLLNAQAQKIDLDATRSQLEHAIAILVGKAPAVFALSPVAGPVVAVMPAIPVGLPSELLERRPDIASAERLVAVANANIGVAKAAYFPSLILSAGGGYSSPGFASLFNTPARVWSLGAVLAGTLFDGGLRSARTDQAIALFDASVAQYKQTVLGGFQEVEDNLAVLRVLANESKVQAQAVQAALLAERLITSQYRVGTVTYVSVVTAQAAALASQRTLVQLQGRQLLAGVALIKATGGGWSAAELVAGAPDLAKHP
ncbi:efflux transporter outer membrane subunit [Herbaspirillum sp. RTI4]|uniref:efflux transporter outer membrane subunit n=1 Tax=Herbaspirillum sp. RTI4 TaxID=3048640 RepID=UPI002AB3E11E|nr:efflux transporter outer membrane subunit [Herbaspirillum sp. RTI4]MDY7578478.1 efflux transporter outer membrane subunit [Herbaspirillum sp. RTI4]MEA9981493.1 efflux transporter outer membrane subunit [Herbaspirillum sp. RTI4]